MLFRFTARHYKVDFAEALACEMFGLQRTIIRTTGLIRAWTRWGARRLIRRRYGAHLIEITELHRSKP